MNDNLCFDFPVVLLRVLYSIILFFYMFVNLQRCFVSEKIFQNGVMVLAAFGHHKLKQIVLFMYVTYWYIYSNLYLVSRHVYVFLCFMKGYCCYLEMGFHISISQSAFILSLFILKTGDFTLWPEIAEIN